jgi:transcriptional regulator with XRE-family HTH domain
MPTSRRGRKNTRQFNTRLKHARMKYGLTQEEMGWVMGLRQSAYSRIESGTRQPTRIHRHMLAAIEALIEVGGYGRYKTRIMDLPYEDEGYAKFWGDFDRVTKFNKFAKYRLVENPFTGAKEKVKV